MGRFHLRKYCYLVLWAALLAAVAGVWFFGREPEPLPEVGTSPSPQASAAPSTPEEEGALVGVWVPYFSLDTAEHTQEAFEEHYRQIAQTAQEKGINAMFVHVRPFSDALYPSAYYPWSHILTGTQGRDPGYDPLEFMIETAHSLGMEFHAWLNPLRVKTAETPAALAENNPYVQLGEEYPQYFMECGGGVYLNPAYPAMRTLIADGAAEIAENYEVDGIHFDDYFYPAEDPALDSAAYEAYAQSVEEPLPLLEWRAANINAMVAQVYESIKAVKPEVVFGISPQGNMQNDEAMGADVATWAAVPGYVDYLAPQLYYSFENEALPYQQALEEWAALPRHQGLELYAGLALYKAGTDADGGTWLLRDNIIALQAEAALNGGYQGVILYSSEYLEAEQAAKEVENAAALLGQY
ncbi:MAG: glycoside hydrolase family 10 protein [Acutalibacter sp.]